METTKVDVEKKVLTNVEYVQVDDYFYLYKIISSIDNQVIKQKNGLCFADDLEEVLTFPESFSKFIPWALYTAETPEIMRTDSRNFQDHLKDYRVDIAKLFDDLGNLKDFSNYKVLLFDTYCELLYEFNKTLPLPQSMYFNYINGNVSNGYYNLEEVLETLEKRNDVIIDVDKKGYKIQTIPYYNNPSGDGRFISFCWQPNQDDWSKVAADMKEYERYTIVMEKIFGFKKYNI